MPTSPSTQPTRADVSLPILRELLAKGQARHPDLASRMQRAATLVPFREVQRDGAGYLVQSECEDNRYYFVSVNGCTCPDVARAPKGYCKHRLSVALLVRCQQEQERARRAMERHVTPALACGPEDGAYFTVTAKGSAYLDGYADAKAGRPRRLQSDPTWLAAYLAGYRDGAEAAQEPQPTPAA